jgi:hypothetical protein
MSMTSPAWITHVGAGDHLEQRLVIESPSATRRTEMAVQTDRDRHEGRPRHGLRT